MRIKIKHIIIGLLPMLLGGCFIGNVGYVRFEILNPAEITHSVETENIAFLNRAPITLNAVGRNNRKGLNEQSLMILDSIVCKNLVRGFTEGRSQFPLSYMENVIYFDERRDDDKNKDDYAEEELRNKIFSSHNFGSIVSLEHYFIELSSPTTFYNSYANSYEVEFQLYLKVLWRVYSRNYAEPIDEYFQTDTLFFLNSNAKSKQLGKLDMIREGCQEAGFNYAIRHLPYWSEEYRTIYRIGARELYQAALHTDNGEWDYAYELWQALDNDSIKRIPKAKALHNLSIYYEMNDQLDSAYYYSNVADSLWNNSVLRNQKETLLKRIKNKEILLKQIR